MKFFTRGSIASVGVRRLSTIARSMPTSCRSGGTIQMYGSAKPTKRFRQSRGSRLVIETNSPRVTIIWT